MSASSGFGSRPAAVELGQSDARRHSAPTDGWHSQTQLESQSWPNSQSLQVQADAILLPPGQSHYTTINFRLCCSG